MGVAAYNRGTESIRRGIASDFNRPVEFELMDRLNSLVKYPDCGKAPEPLIFSHDSRDMWWVNVESKPDGFGYWYKSLNEAVKRWNVQIIQCQHGSWIGVPIEAIK